MHVGESENTLKWDINPLLTEKQQTDLLIILNKHIDVFATSLSEIKSLKVDSYVIKVKSGVKPIKTSPRMLPIVANEQLKEYITQLVQLDMLEVCSEPWAAAVVLVPNNKNDRKPQRRFKKVVKVPKIVTVPGEQQPKRIWLIALNEAASKEEENGP